MNRTQLEESLRVAAGALKRICERDNPGVECDWLCQQIASEAIKRLNEIEEDQEMGAI